MNRDLFLKYSSPQNSNFLTLEQTKSFLKEHFSFEGDQLDVELPKKTPITYEFLDIYLNFREKPFFNALWPFFIVILDQNKLGESLNEIYSVNLKAGDDTIGEFPKVKGHFSFSFEKSGEMSEQGNCWGFELNLSCEKEQEAKSKIETLLSNIRTLLKNISKSLFQIYDLFNTTVETKEKGIVVKFTFKYTEIVIFLTKIFDYVHENYQKINENALKGCLKFDFELSCQISCRHLILGAQSIRTSFFLEFPKIFKELLNKILFDEADNLKKQKESFAVNYINRVAGFCLLYGGNIDVDFKTTESLALCLWKEKNLPFGDMIEEKLKEFLIEGPPFLRRFMETLALFSGPCFLKSSLPDSGVAFEGGLYISEGFNIFLKDLLTQKLK